MLRIRGGRVHDPRNGVDGQVADVCIDDDGRIVDDVPAHARTIDASGMVVMPGGVDMHAHIAGPKVSHARRLLPGEHRSDVSPRDVLLRSGTGGTVPSTFATGYRYSLLGYTTVVDAAAPPLAARHVLSELRDTPMIDTAFLILLGNNQVLFDLVRDAGGRSSDAVRDAVAWWLAATGGWGVKLVNPGGVEAWKQSGGRLGTLDQEVPGHGVTPRQITDAIGTAVHELGLPHPVHIHCHDLGQAGNWKTTLDTMDTLDGRRAHFAHIQFHSYGGKPGGVMRSKATAILDHLAAHPEHSVDVGQVMFGDATTMSADAQISAVLRDLGGDKWINADTEVETGCGIVPYAYKARNAVHALQWGIGLELFLLSPDPWRVVLSTDHPNGGSFLSYPRLIRLLMDRDFRNEQVGKAHAGAMRKTVLGDDLEREYTLNEVAIITRAGPARLLGMDHKGHLGVGADGDVTIYADLDDREEMFSSPRYVVKGGRVVVDEVDLVATPDGTLQRVGVEHDAGILSTLAPLFEERYTVPLAGYAVDEEWLLEPSRTTAAGSGGTA